MSVAQLFPEMSVCPGSWDFGIHTEPAALPTLTFLLNTGNAGLGSVSLPPPPKRRKIFLQPAGVQLSLQVPHEIIGDGLARGGSEIKSLHQECD